MLREADRANINFVIEQQDFIPAMKWGSEIYSILEGAGSADNVAVKCFLLGYMAGKHEERKKKH